MLHHWLQVNALNVTTETAIYLVDNLKRKTQRLTYPTLDKPVKKLGVLKSGRNVS